MNKAGKILSVEPKFAIAGGEVSIVCEGLEIKSSEKFSCYFNSIEATIVGASGDRVLAIVPDNLEESEVEVHIENDGEKSEPENLFIGKKLAENLHLVANPAIDPKDNSIIVTKSGSRGQELPVTLFRLETDGFLSEFSVDILNPTGIAFDKLDRLFVTNRANGEVLLINSDNEVFQNASELGVATGIAFDNEGLMYVGDRSGTVYKISELGDKETWAMLEPSVSAYHMAFGLDGGLFITAPGLCSYDSVYKIDKDGLDTVFYKGLGRPQGLAFDDKGNLFVAASMKGRPGIVKISENGSKSELFVAGLGIVGLCFTRNGEMIISTSDSVYSLSTNIFGVLLD